MIRMSFRVRNRQDHTLMGAVAAEFESEGIHVTHSAQFCPEILAEEGVLTRRGPTKAQLREIRFGWGIAKRMADLQVGQSVVVCDRATISVEGIEGTDRNIRGPASCASGAGSPSSSSRRRGTTCGSTSRRSGRRRSRRWPGRAPPCWRSRRGGRSSWTART